MPHGRQVDGLAASHADRAGRISQFTGHGHHVDRRHAAFERGGHRPEGQCLQRIADQHRQRFAKGDMHGGLAAAKHVVVHAGHVIVNQ